MTSLFVSPHDDDQALFGAVICQREKPLVLICTDSYIQPKRGEVGCSAEARAKETEEACRILGVRVQRLGLHDDEVTEESLREALIKYKNGSIGGKYFQDWEQVLAPALQGGNPHHDIVSKVCLEVFGSRVRQYSTYSSTALYVEGNIKIDPSPEELWKKKLAMECYQSQIRINKPHFDAVKNKPEWLFGKFLHLGCGTDIKSGWVNLDRTAMAPGVIVCDVTTQRLPFDDNTFDYVYSQDFLEHLPPEAGVPVMNEIWRVLRHDGIMDHFVPNAGSANDFGSPSHLSHWNLQCFEHFDVDSYRWKKDRDHEGFIGGFKKALSEVINPIREEDGINRYQAIHVRYAAVKYGL